MPTSFYSDKNDDYLQFLEENLFCNSICKKTSELTWHFTKQGDNLVDLKQKGTL